MSAFVLFVMLGSSALLGGLTGAQIGVERFRRRLIRAARSAPGDQVAIAALQRAMRAEHAERHQPPHL